LDAWTSALELLSSIEPARQELLKTLTSFDNFTEALANVVYQNFMATYRCIKILAAEGVPDAIALWPAMKLLWDHLRGRRGPICEVKEMNNMMMKANKVVEANRGKLEEILGNQKLLTQNLTHEIHNEDTVVDNALLKIHKESDDIDEHKHDDYKHWEIVHHKDIDKQKK
jgi:hypothetical protein